MRSAVVVLLLALACSSPRPASPDDDAATVDDGGVPPSDAAATADAARTADTHLARGVTLDGVAVFQGTRVALFDHGAPATRNAPIVAERGATVRAYVDPGVHAGETLTCELEIREGDSVVAILRDARVITSPSSDETPGSAFEIDVPAGAMTTTASLAVRIVDPTGDVAAPGTTSNARLPRDGSFGAIGARSDGGGLHLVLVPFRWDHDGSHRLPDTSSAQLEIVRSLLLAVYPLAHLEITVHEEVPWDDSLTFSGNVDFGAINAELMTLRASDGAPANAYYYALVSPADTFSAYCGGSCVTGQSYVTMTPEDADYRVGSGQGWSGENAAWTLAHEVGHEHGRSHAPCDAGGADPDFPYASGGIGVWGLDPRTGTFLDPSAESDFMGYCDPTWTSDYTWSAIFERTVAVSALASLPRERSLLVRVGGDVGARVVGEATVRPPHGASVIARWRDALGRTIAVVSAPTVASSGGDERLAVLPMPPPDAAALDVNGRMLALDL